MNEKLRILLLEDVSSDAELVERELRRAQLPFSLQRVDTKEAFVRELEDSMPHLILADYTLPSFDGLSALVIAQKKCPDVPFIFVSGAIGEEMAIDTLKKGATDYVLKDHLSRLVPVVRRALDEAEERIKRKQAEQTVQQQKDFLQNILESLTHPFYVVDTKDYTIKMANSAGRPSKMSKESTCFAITHKRSKPCEDPEHPCPLEQVKKTKKPVVVEHLHYNKDGNVRNIEIHGYPIFDNKGDVIQMIEYCLDITERKKSEDQVRASLKEKEVLLKEIHHRIKNNLQLISSLTNLEAGYIKDKQVLKMLEESQNRIRSIGLIHEKLSESKDLARIDFAGYIQSLVAHLRYSYKVNLEAVKLKINIGDVLLDTDAAIPCGLIINELVSNSLKHAFPEDMKGEICINFHSDDNEFTLIISDNGIGLPKNVDFRNTETLGLQLVCILVDQLKGSIKFDRSGGTEFKITFTEVK